MLVEPSVKAFTGLFAEAIGPRREGEEICGLEPMNFGREERNSVATVHQYWARQYNVLPRTKNGVPMLSLYLV